MNPEEIDRIEFFEMAQKGFMRAEQSLGETVIRNLRIAGRLVRLEFAGSALVEKLTSAFAHLATDDVDPPDLTIQLWDSKSTRTPLPLLMSSLVDLLRLRWFERLEIRKEIKGYHDERVRALFHLGPDILSLFDAKRKVAVYWVESAECVPYYESGYPLTPILSWWLEASGLQLLHSAAVGNATGGVIICGKGGSGKSTSALSCVNSTLGFLGDDYCAVETKKEPTVWSLYSTSKLKGPEDVRRFSRFEHLISNPQRSDEEKALIFLHNHFPKAIVGRFPLRAILVPRIVGGEKTRIAEISTASALRALAPSTMFQLPGNSAEAFRAMSTLVRKVPCHHLNLGTNTEEIPDVIAEFLSH